MDDRLLGQSYSFRYNGMWYERKSTREEVFCKSEETIKSRNESRNLFLLKFIPYKNSRKVSFQFSFPHGNHANFEIAQ